MTGRAGQAMSVSRCRLGKSCQLFSSEQGWRSSVRASRTGFSSGRIVPSGPGERATSICWVPGRRKQGSRGWWFADRATAGRRYAVDDRRLVAGRADVRAHGGRFQRATRLATADACRTDAGAGSSERRDSAIHRTSPASSGGERADSAASLASILTGAVSGVAGGAPDSAAVAGACVDPPLPAAAGAGLLGERRARQARHSPRLSVCFQRRFLTRPQRKHSPGTIVLAMQPVSPQQA